MARRALGSVLGSRGSWVSVMGPRRRRQICGTHVARVVGGGGGIAADSRSQQCFAGHANSLAKPPSSHGRVHSSTRRRACEWELASRFSGVGLAAAVSRRPGRRHWLVAMSRRCPHRLRSKGRLVRRGGGGERARSDAALEDRIGAFDGARRGCSFWRVHGRQRISCLSGGTDPSQRTFRGHRGARRDLVGSPRPPAGLQMFLFMDVRGHLQGQHIWICRAFGAARMRRHAWLASVWYRVQCVGRSVVLCVCVGPVRLKWLIHPLPLAWLVGRALRCVASATHMPCSCHSCGDQCLGVDVAPNRLASPRRFDFGKCAPVLFLSCMLVCGSAD